MVCIYTHWVGCQHIIEPLVPQGALHTDRAGLGKTRWTMLPLCRYGYLPNPSSGRHWALRPDAMSYFGGRSKFKVKAAVWLT